jgi:hypothetical protein
MGIELYIDNVRKVAMKHSVQNPPKVDPIEFFPFINKYGFCLYMSIFLNNFI